jgi:hypothetical protein
LTPENASFTAKISTDAPTRLCVSHVSPIDVHQVATFLMKRHKGREIVLLDSQELVFDGQMNKNRLRLDS